MEQVQNQNLAIKYMLFSSFLFAIMGIFVKDLSDSMSSVEITFFRNVFGVAIILYSVYRNPFTHIGGKLLLLIFRGTIGFIALLAFFYNIANIPLAEAMTFSKTAPIFTSIFAYIFLNEKLNFWQIISIFLGFIGMVFIIQPDGFTLSKTDLLGIFSGIGAGLAYTSVRELRKYYDSRAIVLSFTVIGTVAPAILLIIGTFYKPPEYLDFLIAPIVIPNIDDIISIFALGILATFAQIFMTKAYGETKAGIVATVSYSNILFSLIIGTLILNEPIPNFISFIGIFLIVFSGILVSQLKDKE
jgi:drug/metabolite transporter (DMT)-like permease